VADANEMKRQAAERKKAFQETHGYPAQLVPDVWVGQLVAMNILGGSGTERQLGPMKSSGMLEAIRPDGYVISAEDRVVFIPRESVLQMELYETSERGSRLRLE
jgi:hypothetical protein